MIWPILKYPDPRLREVCEPITSFGHGGAAKALSAQWSTLYFTMMENNGVGLAGPQIGQLKRYLVIKTDGNFPDDSVFMINPVITFPAENVVQEDIEGCLSLPGESAVVPRKLVIKVKYQDVWGKRQYVTCVKGVARIVQHEVDHLDGILFPMRVKNDARLRERYPDLKPI